MNPLRALAFFSLASLCGCATSSNSDAPALKLPAGAGSDLAQKQPVLYLDIQVEDQTAADGLSLSEGALIAAKSELESLLPRMKRFKVYAVFNSAGKQLVQRLRDVGEMQGGDGADEQLPSPDLVLNARLVFNVETNVFSGRSSSEYTHDQTRSYRAEMIYNLTNGASGEVLDVSSDASGTIKCDPINKDIGRTVKMVDGKPEMAYAGAFDPNDPNNQASVSRQLVGRLNKKLAEVLARTIPLTARITGVRSGGEIFGMDKGTSHGVYLGGEVAIWAKVGAFDIVLADAISEPTIDRSSLTVTRWNLDDVDAEPIIRSIRANPDVIARYELLATTKSIPDKEIIKFGGDQGK